MTLRDEIRHLQRSVAELHRAQRELQEGARDHEVSLQMHEETLKDHGTRLDAIESLLESVAEQLDGFRDYQGMSEQQVVGVQGQLEALHGVVQNLLDAGLENERREHMKGLRRRVRYHQTKARNQVERLGLA